MIYPYEISLKREMLSLQNKLNITKMNALRLSHSLKFTRSLNFLLTPSSKRTPRSKFRVGQQHFQKLGIDQENPSTNGGLMTRQSN
jgi:hypothetical protein